MAAKSLLVHHISATLQNKTSLKIICSTLYPFMSLPPIHSSCSSIWISFFPLHSKCPVINQSFFHSIGTRFHWGPPYWLVIPSSSFPNGSFSLVPPLNVRVLPGPALDHFIFFVYLFSLSDAI